MLEKMIQQFNERFFFPRALKLDFLKNAPEVIPHLAKWTYDEWTPYGSELTMEKLIQSLNKRLNVDQIPMTFVVLNKSLLPVGAISLKRRKEPEFLDFPAESLWLGGLHVSPEARNQGIGNELLQFAQDAIKVMGYETLYFYTSNPERVDWYVKRGAEVMEKRPFQNHEATVMRILLK